MKKVYVVYIRDGKELVHKSIAVCSSEESAMAYANKIAKKTTMTQVVVVSGRKIIH
jgi:hypothetical protein